MHEFTLDDCNKLKEAFDRFTEHAEQHMFTVLAMCDLKMEQSILKWTETHVDQKECQSMFNVVLKVIGKDPEQWIKENLE